MSTIPYTYVIGWKKRNIRYYGVRYSRGCEPQDLWTKYFTSSKHVAAFRAKNGEPDIIEVRKIFEDVESARDWEVRVLTRLRVRRNINWLNYCANKSFEPKYGDDNPAKRSEVRAKMSVAKIGKPLTEEHKANLSKAHQKRFLTCSGSRKGILHTVETRKKMSMAKLGKTPPNKGQKGVFGWFTDGKYEQFMRITEVSSGWQRGRHNTNIGRRRKLE